MQPGEFTLPGRLRALPQRQSHSIIKQPCSRPYARAQGVHCKATSLGSAFWDPTDPNQSDSSRDVVDVVQPNSLGTNPPFPFLPCSSKAAPCNHGSTGKHSRSCRVRHTQSTAKPGPGAEGECFSHSLHPWPGSSQQPSHPQNSSTGMCHSPW